MTTHTREELSKGSFGGEFAAGLGRILFVRHGKGRGPIISYRDIWPDDLDPMLADFARRDPKFRKRISIWETGSEKKPYLYDVQLIVFLLQDPLRELYPECYADAMDMVETARRLKIQVVNSPEAMSNTIKSVESGIWREHGLPSPRHYPFRSTLELREASEYVTYPAVLTADRLHQRSANRVVYSRRELMEMDPERIVFPGALSEFIDTRRAYETTQPESEFARYYHKKQVLVFGDQVRYGHVFFSEQPLVTTATSTLRYSTSLNPWKHLAGRIGAAKHIRIDNEFASQEGHPSAGLFVQAARALKLEWVAIDYSTFANGDVMLWDAKAHFPLHQGPMEWFRFPRTGKERHRRTHELVRQYLQRRMAA